MTPILTARVFLTITGAIVWGYGYRADQAPVRLAGLGILAVALLLRFLPHRWLGDDDRG